MYDTLEDFYLAEALEYIHAWKQATADNPVGICGPIGPTDASAGGATGERTRPVAEAAHFWGMDEWYRRAHGQGDAGHASAVVREGGSRAVLRPHRQELRIPEAGLHVPKGDVSAYVKSWSAGVRCAVMQGAATSSTGPSTIR